jgi:hypothetical protein
LGDWSKAYVTVGAAVLVWKMTLVSIGHPLAARAEFVSPDKRLSGLPTTSGEFPLRFGGQALAGPLRIGQSVFIGDLDDGVVVLAVDVALRTERVTPVRARDVAPPLEVIV